MRADGMFVNIKRTAKKAAANPMFQLEVAAMMGAFFSGQISQDDFTKMEPADRATLAGCIAGRFASRYPEEVYEALKAMEIH